MKLKNKVFIFMAIANILICSAAYAKSVNNELSQNILRLHILANSNSEYDQNIKMQVRDIVLEMAGDKKYNNKQKVIKDLENFEGEINDYLKKEGAEYGAVVSYTKHKFDRRDYKDLSMPCGNYECVRVVLGDGGGKNWWCVAYPPLCFTKSVLGTIDENNEELKKQLSTDTYNTIIRNGLEFEIRFKTVDLLNSIINKIT